MFYTNFMDFSAKIRAARAILDLKQSEIATEAGISVPGYQNIEAGKGNPNTRTQNKLVTCFEEKGIRFTRDGVELPDNPIMIISAETPEKCYIKVLSDVLQRISGTKHELLISHADDKVSPPTVNDIYRTLRSQNIRMRQLVEEGKTYLMGDLEEYRYIPKKYFINRVTVIYGDNIAVMTGGENFATVTRDPINAEMRRLSFNYMWDTCKQPTESEADERF